ncbi:MAG: hypothetical protein ACI910_002330 [Oleispira sp.]|jgi:hypothetical protein
MIYVRYTAVMLVMIILCLPNLVSGLFFGGIWLNFAVILLLFIYLFLLRYLYRVWFIFVVPFSFLLAFPVFPNWLSIDEVGNVRLQTIAIQRSFIDNTMSSSLYLSIFFFLFLVLNLFLIRRTNK